MWTFYNSSGESLTSFGPVALTDLDIDGGTDVGEAIVDADLFIIDNGAGGTNVKTAASRIKTYVGAPVAASQAEMESASSNTVFATPGRTQHHPGVAKVTWNGFFNGTAAEHASYGVDSFTDNGVGDHTFTFDTAFSSINYSWCGSVGHSGGELMGGISITQYDTDASARSTTTLRVSVAYGHYTSGPLTGHNFTKVDTNELDIMVFGDQ